MQRHARAEALGVHCLAELRVGHRDGGFVIPCRRELQLRPLSAQRGTCWPTISAGMAPSPLGQQGMAALPVLTQLLDALLVLDEELHPRDVDVQAGALWGPLHRRVKAAVILAVR